MSISVYIAFLLSSISSISISIGRVTVLFKFKILNFTTREEKRRERREREGKLPEGGIYLSIYLLTICILQGVRRGRERERERDRRKKGMID